MILNTPNGQIYISFNQLKNYCCFGTDIGFYVYQLAPFKKMVSRKIDGGVSMVKMLHESNIFIFVGKSKTNLYPRNKLIIWNDENKSVLGEINFNSDIKNVNITKEYILVLCNNKIYIYQFDNLSLVRSVDVSSNDIIMGMGIEGSKYLIYTSDEKGVVTITKFDEDYFQQITAHQNEIDILRVSNDGKYLITASTKGTLVRIFDINSGELIQEVRRGCDPVKILDLSLSNDNSVLLVSSIKGTLHLYNTHLNEDCDIKNKSWDDYGMKYIRNVLPDYFNSQWSFSQIYLSGIETFSVVDNTAKKVYVLGNNGQYYIVDYEDTLNPVIEKTVKYISDESDPFSERSTTIR
uniref:Anaphase-promoting complex subunit 4 WD40 domain-containing protein n=1 Tax=viral metagenome TaxID=1070528 RepID=A0A6C0B4P9_9ZZZZ